MDVWRYKRRKKETWGARYWPDRSSQCGKSLGTFGTQLEAMLAHDDAEGRHILITKWGRRELRHHPELTISQMVQHDRGEFEVEGSGDCTFAIKVGNRITYLTETGFASAIAEEQRLLNEALS